MKIEWNGFGERFFDAGVSNVALYLDDGLVVPWSGIKSIQEKFDDTPSSTFIDGIKVDDVPQIGSYAATITALTYPLEFSDYEGWVEPHSGIFADGQAPKPFNMVYKTLRGNDLDGLDFGYRLHLLYGLLAVPSDISRGTQNDGVTPIDFSWDISSIPRNFPGYRPTSHYILDSWRLGISKMSQIESILFGSETDPPYLPPPEDILSTLSGWSVVDNGDGTWTASSTDPNTIVTTGPGQFQINYPLAVYVDENTYTLTS